MSYNDRNNGQFPSPFISPTTPGQAGQINAAGLANQIAARINTDATHGQIVRAIQKYNDLITPVIYTLEYDFSSTGEITSINQTFDSSYGFFGYGWSVVAESTDPDFVVNSLQITQQTSIIINDFPALAVKQLTAQFAPLFWYVPANSTVTLNLTNGSTTANNHCYFSFYGTRVPYGMIQNLTKGK